MLVDIQGPRNTGPMVGYSLPPPPTFFADYVYFYMLAYLSEYFSNYCLPDTSNMEYDSGVRISIFPSIFKLIFVDKSFEVHYKSEYKTSRKL